MQRVSIAVLSVIVTVLSIGAGRAEPPGLIPNASFEVDKGGNPAGWSTQRWSGEGQHAYSIIARTGQRSVSLQSKDGADISWGAIIPVKPWSRYRLTGWIKTAGVATKRGGRGALLNLHNIQPVATRALTGTNDWTRVQAEFDTESVDAVQINCLFGGWGHATGIAWYDDLELELLSTREWKPVAKIDAAKTGAPISKYIYGQFIEHLGRCIYGGIWAEMLEDRKFWDAVGKAPSPWRVIGGAVSMERESSFVGEHTPSVALAAEGESGIAQGGLGLVIGKRYDGRVWIAGDPAAGPVSVRLVWGDGPADRQAVTVGVPNDEYRRAPFSFVCGGTTNNGRLEIVASGTGRLRVGTVSLMPADNVKGMRRDTLALLKELDSPVYRWPGGNFVSGYDWKDGLGDRDRRPPRKNPAWKGIEHNDVGIDEFMVFCRELGTEPYIAVNSGLGGVESAIEELQYANGATDTPMGKLRAANGHPEPYRVEWWGIGNEMYGGWQLGHMSLEKYIEKHNRFAEAMRAEDASIQLVAVGAVGRWSEGMMRHCADHMELVSEHFYRQLAPGLASHVRQIPDSVRNIANAHRDYRRRFESLRGKDIRIALDEWNYWYGPHVYGELGTRYFLKDALGVAAGLNEFARHSDIYFMANYAQTVNVIGCIKTTKTAAAFATTGLVLKLYRQRFGTIPVAVESTAPLDVMAAFTADRRALTIAVVNPTRTALELPIEVAGVDLATTGRSWEIAGDDPEAYNEPGVAPRVWIEPAMVAGIGKALPLAASSVTLFEIPVATADGAESAAAERSGDYPIRPVPFSSVHVTGGIWADRLETNRVATIPHSFQKCEETGRLANFARAGGLEEGGFQGTYFNDSDVYKVIEGACYSLIVEPDPELEKFLDDLIATIAAAQDDDGYLYTARTLQDARYAPPGGKERWSDIGAGHELYCVGHMYEAAVAHWRATGKRTLLDVAIRSADLVDRVFGPGKRTWPPGHQEIEIGLARLYRVTGEERYVKLAQFFLDARGRKEGRGHLYGSYSQDHIPVIEQEEAVGHSVRAGYLFAGMADVAALTGNEDYVRAIGKLWQNVVGKKLFITGGIGATGAGEGFGGNYELPNLVAYCETCAAFANAFWNQRMFLMHGDGKYADVLERILYNNALSGIALDGKNFFYPNPLESDGRHARSPWFGCACCPSNVARFIPSVPGYAYAVRSDELFVNLFLEGHATVEVGALSVELRQETDYPWSGKVWIAVTPDPAGAEFALKVRIPGWARNEAVPSDLYRFLDRVDAPASLRVNGETVSTDVDRGYATIRRAWGKGDVVELELPLPVRRVLTNDKVAENRGRVALQRGPVVFCVEGVDVEEGHVVNLRLADDEKLAVTHREELLGGVTVLEGRATRYRWTKEQEVVEDGEVAITAIPYYAWAHRGRCEMAVWLGRTPEGVRPLPAATIASRSRATASRGNVGALADQRDPKSSADHSNRFLHFWPQKGTKEWVQYDFAERTRVQAVEVYWFDDTGIGACRLPASWKLLYRDGGEWKPVENPSGYSCEGDKYVRTTFDPIEADGLRIEIQLQEQWAAGVHEWRVK